MVDLWEREEEIGDCRLILGDCMEVMADMPGDSVDSVVTDPPYGLKFMGQKWDYDVPSVAIWRQALRVLKPGGHLLAFSGTRTSHRMVCNIEDAGFEIRDTIMWVYGSGFPKSHDVSKGIDKAAGAEGNYGEAKTTAHAGWIKRGKMRGNKGHEGYQRPWMNDSEAVDKNAREYLPATATARQWQGWGPALKPALEPICLARKPLIGTVAANVMEHGTGALNIDGCRVGTEGGTTRSEQAPYIVELNSGRWPANLIHDGSDEVVGLFPQGGASGRVSRQSAHKSNSRGAFSGLEEDFPFYGDSGSATRFFYTAKASKADRDDGLEGFVRKPRQTMGDGIGSQPDQQLDNNRNVHPAVKPTDLMRYLCRLITPPGGVVLDPFMGGGSTGMAAQLEGFRFIGIEREPEYFEIACQRISKAASQPDMFLHMPEKGITHGNDRGG